MSQHSEMPAPHGALARAQADLAAGREWKARDRLLGYLAGEYDPEALELLGELHHRMRDLPAAGAAWFGTTRRGAEVDEAIEAWRERHSDNFVQMWHSLPRSVRDHEGNKRVDALRRRAERDQPAPVVPSEKPGGIDPAVIIAVVLAVLVVVCAVIGFVQLLRWIVPGG
ncbi:DUF6584 family protein [Pedococcus sp. 5OH_020]|uniref:DUF6584 family protein n=1 Tax=Pedococcus sp. 5OH_020 TaxID=2989814 RepID=UPI0022E9FAFC|nr:DUF6584 family protein [Pedococcus sp. 5OH_020]